jgi:hypothetical protein
VVGQVVRTREKIAWFEEERAGEQGENG